MSLRHQVLQYVGQHIQCHTYYGTFHGVVVHCTKHHLILAPLHPHTGRPVPPPRIITAYGRDHYATGGGMRPFGMGPMGPQGPGPGPGPGQGPSGPGPGSGWHMAIPLAAILGITALGMHWW